MNGNCESPSTGDKSDAPTTNDLRPYGDLGTDDRETLATQLRALADGVEASLRDLADEVEAGDQPGTETVLETRDLLEAADSTVRRHLDGVESRDYENVIRDPREGSDMTRFSDRYDVEYLAEEAGTDEIAEALAADFREVRLAVERIDRALYAGDLTDVLATDLWDSGDLLAAWGREVMVSRADRDYRFTREEAEALDRANEKSDGGNGHA
jgi:hypothetical protein